MGTRFVFKKGEITYIVSDVSPQINASNMDGYNTCIEVVQKDVILAFRTHDLISDILSDHKEWFLTDDNRPMDKKHVIEHIVKPLIKKAIQLDFFEEKPITMDNVIYIITKQRIFEILAGFSVVEANGFLSADVEEEFAFCAFNQQKEDVIADQCINDLMKDLHSHLIFIQRDYVYMDNENYQYVYVKGGN
jgi:hypothetical protein